MDRFVAIAQLLVDTSLEGAAVSRPLVAVTEIGLEGLGLPCDVSVKPALIRCPGSLLLGQVSFSCL